MNEMKKIKFLSNEEARSAILEIKNGLLLKNGHTPKNSSYYVYEAYLFENIRDMDGIKKYLLSKGIVLY